MAVGTPDLAVRQAPDPTPLLRPRSVAVVGANDRPGSYGDEIFRNLAAAGFAGAVWGVNPKRDEVHGRPCVPRVADLPEPVDAVVVAIPVYTPPDSQPVRRAPDVRDRRPSSPPPARLGVRDVGDSTIRVLLSSKLSTVEVAAPGAIEFSGRDGRLLTRGARSGTWRIEHEGRRVRARGGNGIGSRWTDGSLVVVTVEGRRLLLGLAPNHVSLVTELQREGTFDQALTQATVQGAPQP